MITFILAVCGNVDYVYSFPQSPPSRAAWIEIFLIYFPEPIAIRRRLHGRRGLKLFRMCYHLYKIWSPPSRAAWIEIINLASISGGKFVAAFTGGVD